MNKVSLFLLALIVFLVGWWVLTNKKESDEGWIKLKVNQVVVKVQVRDTMEGRNRGLSGIEKLDEDKGVLFVFKAPAKYSFWMKEMKFDLDVLWIKGDKVVGKLEGVKAPKDGESPARFKSKVLVDKVLEVNSGFIKENGIQVGDEISY